MLSRLALIGMFAALALVPGSLAGARATSVTAWVAAEDDNMVVAVDVASGKVVKRIAVPGGPHNIAATPDGKTVVVASPSGQSVTLISGKTRRIAHIFTGFSTPYDVAVSANGRYAYVTDKSAGKLVVLDLRARNSVGSVAVGTDPQDLSVGKRIWITHGRHGEGSLTGVDVATPTSPRVVGSVATQLPSHDVSAQPGSAKVYITYWDSRFVGGVDTGTGRIIFRRQAGKDAQHLAYDFYSGNRIWVTDHGSNKVLVLSTRNGKQIKSLPCRGARDLAFGAGFVAVSCRTRLLIARPNFRGVRMIAAGNGLHGVALGLTPR